MNRRLTSLLLLCVLPGCGTSEARPEGAAARAAAAPKAVTLSPVTTVELERSIAVTGVLEADERVTVGVKVPGRLAEVLVDLATPVDADQIIARVDPTDFRLRVDQAAAELAQARALLGLPRDGNDAEFDEEQTAIVIEARATLEQARAQALRSRELSAEGLMTAMERDAAEAGLVRAETAVQSALEQVRIRRAAVRQREAALRLARQQLADTAIRSPLKGVVEARLARVGEFAAAGAPVATVVRLNPLRLRVEIPERDAPEVRVGQRVRVNVEGDPTHYDGQVARLSPSLDTRTRTLLVEADIVNPGTLRPGSFVRAHVVLGKKSMPSVPASAVVAFAGLQKVLVVQNGKAVEKRVTIGARVGDRVEITSGLEAGESVVTTPGNLQQGQSVVVKG